MQVEVTPLSGDIRIDALLQSTHWAHTPGGPLAISGSFAGPESLWPGGSGGYTASDSFGPSGGVSALDEAQKSAFRSALMAWAQVARLQPSEVPDSGSSAGTIRIAWTSGPVTEQSWAYGPSSGDKGGDVWLNGAAAWDAFLPGSYGYATMLHELGHALGLKDPAEGTKVLAASVDGYSASVMSSNAFAGSRGSWVDFEPTTPMPYDILAMQYLYGANTSSRTGNDSYAYSAGQRVFETIWDAGGTDSIVWTGSTGVTIDLNPGAFSTLGAPLTYWSEDFKSSWTDARTVAVAFGTVIENAVGGSGADRLVGNAADNRLVGGAGNDTLDGAAGRHDVADYRVGGAVAADLKAGTATRGSEVDSLISIEALFGSTAADTLLGLDGLAAMPGEVFRGGAGNDTIDGGTGIDLAEFAGSRAAYTLSRQAGTMNISVSGPDGSDTLRNVELLLFADRIVGFGQRAEEVARVAFGLWSPAIAGSATLFSKGLSFYTNEYGYNFDTLCQVALQYFPESGAATAARLKASLPATAYSTAQLLDIMAGAGGVDSTAGRAAAVKAVALDPAMTTQLELAGVFSQGVVATLGFPGEGVDYFGPLPG